MKYLLLTWLILTGMIVSCDIFQPGVKSGESRYPTTFHVLTTAELDSLETQYMNLNASQYCGVLDRFGFTGTDYCYRQSAESGITEAQAVILAREALIRNRQFTNVNDESNLTVQSAEMNSAAGYFAIMFQPQRFMDVSVIGTEITVVVNAEGVFAILNHWYPDFYLPAHLNLDSTAAKDTLAGTSLTFYGFDGKPNDVLLERSALNDFKVIQAVIPHRTEEAVEMRLTWRVGVTFTSPEAPGWYVYVDAITGERIRIEQLFRT